MVKGRLAIVAKGNLRLVFIVIRNLLKRRIAMSIVDIQLSEACFGHHNIFQSSNEKLVLTRLQQKAEYHQNHAALRLKFFSHDHDLSLIQIFTCAYQFVDDFSKCSHLALLSNILERLYFIWPNSAH